MKHLLSLVFFTFFTNLSQAQKENPLQFYEPLMGKTWVIDAKWGDGSAFKQEIEVGYGLQRTIVNSSTRGFIDSERTKFGDRSVGIRQYDEASNRVLFWEFDTFGGVTQGEVIAKGRDIWYVYFYGGVTLADIWQYQDDDTYAYKIVSYENDEMGDTYLEGVFKAKK